MRARKLIAALLAVMAIAGCGGDGITEPDTVAGKYVLRTVDNKPAPFVVYEEPGYKLEITYADFLLTTNGTFTNNATWRETEQGVVRTETEVSSGTFTENGPSLSFVSPGGDTFQGTRVGNRLTLTSQDEFGSSVVVFEK